VNLKKDIRQVPFLEPAFLGSSSAKSFRKRSVSRRKRAVNDTEHSFFQFFIFIFTFMYCVMCKALVRNLVCDLSCMELVDGLEKGEHGIVIRKFV
jgi:hypothetical protein